MDLTKRYYPPINANTHRLNRFLYQLAKADPALLKRFVADRRAALIDSPLTPEEQDAFATIDLPRLVALGAHPFLARNLSSTVHRLEHEDEYAYF